MGRTPPGDLNLRVSNPGRQIVAQLDAANFMSSGPGSYANPADIPFIKTFFGGQATLQAWMARFTRHVVRILRVARLLLMFAGLTAALLMLFIKPLTLMIFRQPGDNGVGFFVVGVFLYAFTGASWLGLGAFEAGRLLGKHHGKPTDNR
jgi:hypothetical protein